jgi:large subunit ribosomal protein L18
MARAIRKRTSIKLKVQERRRSRVRKRVQGTAERPRLCVTKTNRKIVVQLVNDDLGQTLFSVATPKGKTANLSLAQELGQSVASQAIGKGIKRVVFDRGGKLFHGRIAAVATAARAAGLEF